VLCEFVLTFSITLDLIYNVTRLFFFELLLFDDSDIDCVECVGSKFQKQKQIFRQRVSSLST